MRKLLVLLAAAAFVASFSIPAMAEVSFYGQSRMKTYMFSQDEDAGDDSDLNWDLDAGNSRLGANFLADDVGAKFEMSAAIGLRHCNAWWEGGFGKLVVGQDWTPTFQPIDEAVISNGTGSFGGSVREPQLALHMGSLVVALRKPTSSAILGAASADLDTPLPAVEASYELTAGPAGITLFLGYNAYDDVDATDKAYSVTSSVLGGNVALSFGAVVVKATVWTAANGLEGDFFGDATAAQVVGTEVKDTTSTGFAALFGYTISDTMKIYAGYGATNSEVDVSGTETDTDSEFYVNLPITMAKGFTLTPEVSVRDHGEDTAGAKEGSETRYGARWRIDF